MSLGDIVNRAPGAARVLEGFALDYCCGGQRSLRDACAVAEVDLELVVVALNGIELVAVADWVAMGPFELVGHIESTHHRFLHAELARLDSLAEKVACVHGGRHSELLDVLADVKELRDELEPHMASEERVVFPMIRQMAEPGAGTRSLRRRLRTAISSLMSEHDAAGALLERLRNRTDDYLVPDDACGSYRQLYDGLLGVEVDTHLHVHKENNLLFPAMMELSGRPPR